ncbi:SprT-like domain-containing protein [Alkalilimnicola ehrlichii MLHE-1]|uniref:SprT-like domain-containing protein n=1 Tax=Alkalilimnicola ehrlichii (strain ATCC BAA-1101 / DSM 17681 / MLHE-1) TaxID=187272 RepID=Q0A8D8_ALKEH|nr:SprT-like domain-containing protein [Alkalilimnicola ehrlichii]ABI56899.1 protein of unknown function DUF335, SprT [Alkalilimnicola ehrlichii MLHE-1]
MTGVPDPQRRPGAAAPAGCRSGPPPATEAECLERLKAWARADWRALCRQWPALQGLPAPEVVLYRRGSALGRAWLRPHRIGLNAPLIRRPDGWREARDTVAHELAHLAAWTLFRDRGHGAGWQQVMAVLGAPPTRTHALDVSGIPGTQRRWQYRCGCSTHRITTTRHNRIRQGRMRYHCRRCGEALSRDADSG